MINEIKLNNFGPLNQLCYPDLGSIHLVIGKKAAVKRFF
jgi:hypothetical protein